MSQEESPSRGGKRVLRGGSGLIIAYLAFGLSLSAAQNLWGAVSGHLSAFVWTGSLVSNAATNHVVRAPTRAPTMAAKAGIAWPMSLACSGSTVVPVATKGALIRRTATDWPLPSIARSRADRQPSTSSGRLRFQPIFSVSGALAKWFQDDPVGREIDMVTFKEGLNCRSLMVAP
jgi:hypothetical protein